MTSANKIDSFVYQNFDSQASTGPESNVTQIDQVRQKVESDVMYSKALLSANKAQTFSDMENPTSSKSFVINRNASNSSIESILQEWRGVVLSVSDSEIEARIADMTDRSAPDEIVTFNIQEFDTHDIPHLIPGATFYWHIGYRQGAKVPRENFSKIRLSRLPNWSKNELERASKKADEYVRQLNRGQQYPAR